MNGKQIVDLLMFRLGHRSEATVREAAVLEIAMVQEQEFEQGHFKPWFLWREHTADEFYAPLGALTVTLPDSFLGLEEELIPYVYYKSEDLVAAGSPSPWVRLPVIPLKDLELRQNVSGPPEACSVVGNVLYVAPVPDMDYVLKLPGYYADVAFSDSEDATLWTKHAADLLLSRGLYHVAMKHVSDMGVAQSAAVDAQAARVKLYNESISRMHAGLALEKGSLS